jgi:hypothetical protein
MDTTTTQTSGTGSVFGIVIACLFAIVMIAAMWKVFTKAGYPGWAAIVPFYNTYTLLKIVGRPGWWLVLMFIPFVNVVIAIIVAIDLAKSFGKSGVFAFFGLILFSFIGYSILGFGSARYLGPAAAGPATQDPGQQYPGPQPGQPSPAQQSGH